MKSFVFTSDWHLRGLPPSTIQTEGFLDLLFNRLSTILGRQVDFIIHGGDFFDSYICDDISLLNQVISLLKECNKKIYIVPGNHDLIGYEQKSILWTSLKTLENAGLLKILPPGLNVIEGINFYVVYPTKDHGPHIYSGLKDCFVLTHNLVSTVKMPFKVTLTDEIAPYLKQCIVLCGDLHYPFVKVYENCAFFNPGALIDYFNENCNEGSGFFEVYFDPSSFSCKYKKFLFPKAPFEKITIEKETSLFEKVTSSKFFTNVEELVDSVIENNYPPNKVNLLKEEAHKWIKITKESIV